MYIEKRKQYQKLMQDFSKMFGKKRYWNYSEIFKILILQFFSEIKVKKSGIMNPKDFRADHNLKPKIYQLKDKKECFVCLNQSFIKHHVIQLQNGGSNVQNNIVFLCEDCHCKIHPWLKK